MRMIVNYRWGVGSYGSRQFDAPEDSTKETIERLAQAEVPQGILEITSIERVDEICLMI